MTTFFQNLIAFPVVFVLWLFGTTFSYKVDGKKVGTLRWFKYTRVTQR